MTTAIVPTWTHPLWLRQDFESPEEYQAFATLVSLPRNGRNLQQVAEFCGENRTHILRLSDRHHWPQRVAAHDAHMAQDARSLLTRDTDDVRANGLRVLEKARRFLERELDVLLDRQSELQAQGGRVSLIKIGELSAMIERTVKYTQLLMGEATERIEEAYDFSEATPDELAHYAEFMRKFKKETV